MLNKANDRILNKKFTQYLIPSIAMCIGATLNEFVDAIVVTNLLGDKAMAYVNMGIPIVYICFASFCLLGNGGAIIFGQELGKHEKEKAGKIFSVIFLTLTGISIILFLICIFNVDSLSALLCKQSDMVPIFRDYIRYLIICIPVMIITNGMSFFFPALGFPQVATILTIITNGINLLLDYVYISVFDMGVAGASLATLTGNIIGAIYIIILVCAKKNMLIIHKPSLSELKILPKAAIKGGTIAAIQVGTAVKMTYCNAMAATLGGAAGIVVFSLCMQLVSMVSIVSAGIISTISPILSVLFGQEDYHGIKLVYYKGVKYMLAGSVFFAIIFIIFPGTVCNIYQVKASDVLNMAKPAVIIYSSGIIIRAMFTHFPTYLQTIGMNAYATIITLLDGFILIIPVCVIMSKWIGINALWWGYPVSSLLLMTGVLLTNMLIWKKNPSKYESVLLQEKDSVPALYCSLDVSDASAISEKVQNYIAGCGGAKNASVKTAAIVEDMIVYTSKAAMEYPDIDLTIKVKPEHIIMDFRSIGEPLDILTAPEPEQMDSLMLIRKASDEILYDRTLGINMTRIIINNYV